VATVTNARRYALLASRFAARASSPGLQAAWRGVQASHPGTPIAEDFPAHDALVAAGYTAAEDLDGTDFDELVDAGLSPSDARAVTAALA
jgi:hypothetical protein